MGPNPEDQWSRDIMLGGKGGVRTDVQKLGKTQGRDSEVILP